MAIDLFKENRFIEATELMQALGYRDRASFWLWVKREGLPRYQQSARRVLFDTGEVREWFEKRKIGRSA